MDLYKTNDDATSCRLSCHKKGYLDDPYVEWFASCDPKSPIINRGTYLRTMAIDSIVVGFLNKYPQGQILSLGAGYDTRYFRLQLKCVYVEIDVETVVMSKIGKLRKHAKQLTLENCIWHPTTLHSTTLQIKSLNILECSDMSTVIDFTKKTLVLAECLFVYLNPDKVDSLLLQLYNLNADCVVYDPLELSDGFSEQMIMNLLKRNITLSGLHNYKTLPDQIDRFKRVGYTVDASDMSNFKFDSTILDKMKSIEFLDEYEEWNLFQSHYFVLYAARP